MANTYSDNCTMDRVTMLKFGRVFDLAKFLEHTQKVSAYGVRQGASSVASHQISGSMSPKLIQVGS